jgi:hypothetical protein
MNITLLLAQRLSEAYVQMVDMGADPQDDTMRIMNALSEQIALDLQAADASFDLDAFLSVAGKERHPLGSIYGNPGEGSAWVIYPHGQNPYTG